MPQPIDFQTELSRIAAVERVQQVADRLAVNAQQRLAHEIQEERTLAETQVEETQAKSGEVEPELKRKNPFIGRRRRREKDDEAAGDEESTGEAPEPGTPVPMPLPEPHSLDVSI